MLQEVEVESTAPTLCLVGPSASVPPPLDDISGLYSACSAARAGRVSGVNGGLLFIVHLRILAVGTRRPRCWDPVCSATCWGGRRLAAGSLRNFRECVRHPLTREVAWQYRPQNETR